MNSLTLTDLELNSAGPLGEGVSGPAAVVVNTMQEHPDLLKLSLFTLECINLMGHCGPSSFCSPGPLAPSHMSMISSSTPTFTSVTTASQYGPDEYERLAYYNGITGDNDHPELIYRSDFLTTPFPKPVGRFANIPVKSLRGVFDTPLNSVWDTVGPQIRNLIKAQGIHWSSIDPARFFTHAQPGEMAKGSLGPVVIWIGVRPGSTSSGIAHEVSQEILGLLLKNNIGDIVVEWREALPQRLAGPPLLHHVNSLNPTHHFRRYLTALLGLPLTVEEMEKEDAQGTLTLWFHENNNEHGRPSNKVYGVSSCHVLRKNTMMEYEHQDGARKNHIRVCSMHRFQRGLEEIMMAIADHGIVADLQARELAKLQANEIQDAENVRRIQWTQSRLDEAMEAITELEGLYDEVIKGWSNMKLQRNIGYLQYAAAITVDEGGTGYTSDWAVFLAAEAKVKAHFEGNIVDLGSKYSVPDLIHMFYPVGGSLTAFEFPAEGKLRIEGCATKEDLARAEVFDSEGQRCLMVGKVGNSTDLTIGRYAGLVSYTRNEVGIESVELGIYNSGIKNAEVFSTKGDSGSLVWHMIDGKARIVGQLHSGVNKGGLTSNHVSYCTPGWYLLAQIKEKFKYADFYRTTW